MPILKPVSLCVAALAAVLPFPVCGQSAAPYTRPKPVFQANVRTVVVDVVVTDRKGKPVEGLTRNDFIVKEDGKLASITSFEEHSGVPPTPVRLPDLPPNVFTNVPRVQPAGAVTVLLLDGLNTELQDQTIVRRQMLKYLQGLQPGRRVAIFTLGTQLRFVQGFTDDPALLAAALKDPKRGARQESSAVLQSRQQLAADQKTTAAMAEHAYAAAAVLQQFQAEQSASQTGQRVNMTLQAFQELANYLAGVPGRKNVVWFSSAFPQVLFGNSGLNDSFAVQSGFGEQIRKTNVLMAGAQMAIYPVGVEGLTTGSLFDVDQQFGAVASGQSPTQPPPAQGTPQAQQATTQQNNAIQSDAIQRNANHTTMDDIARATGGTAFYNTNGLNDALARVVENGSSFYTLSYTPTEPGSDGRLRKIEIKLGRGGDEDKLAYRRAYYPPDAKAVLAAEIKPVGDPMLPYMLPGKPESTQIPLALRVLPAVAPESSGAASQAKSETAASAHAGDNPNLKGPLIRYSVDFVIAAKGLQLDAAPDGSRHGRIEATLVVYGQGGKALNWMVRQLDLDMDAARFAQVQGNGINFSLEIDAPKNPISLRGGVYDLRASLAGTLEIPFTSIRSAPSTAAGVR